MLYRFADCALDTQLYTLERAGQSTRLAPKVFEVLCYLIAHRDRVVSKQELCEQVWEGLAITDATLESCLRAVRLTVGDSGQAQRIIQTQRGHGYRFVADLALLPNGRPTASLPLDAAPPPLTPAPGVPRVRPCAACQHTNQEDATFCTACGMRLRQLCAHCGQEIFLPATFCTACRQSLIVPSPPGPVAALAAAPVLAQAGLALPHQNSAGAERKLVTVLCGTVASTAAGGARCDLDTLYRVMQELHDLAYEVVCPYGGRLLPPLGDRLLILFGVPEVHEDDARRAVRMALELRRRWQGQQAGRETGASAPWACCIGLHTGMMVVDRRPDAAALAPLVGEVVSVAQGLQEQATPGQILCSASTARWVQSAVRLTAVAPVPVPGQPTPVPTYTVLRPRGQRAPGWARWGRALSPFVGRERECATLHALLAQVARGRGQVVGVVGEPGIGKSRLLYEFRQSLAGQRLRYLTGRGLAYGSTTPYLPVIEILRHYCGILESDRPEAIAAKLSRALQAVEMVPAAWAPVLLPLLGVPEATPPAAPLSPEARKARTLTAVTQMCLHGSRHCPLILELEDLHWIDTSSEECLTVLVERMAGAALLVLVTYRPGYRPAWVAKSYATQVALPPLSPQASLRVVQAVLPAAGQAAPLVPQLLTKAEGNPFFLEELARTMAEQGAAASLSAVPDTVQAVLTARMDRLPATAKRLLQAAAVIGKDVALPLLQTVTAVSEEAIHYDLRHLQAAEFLYETYARTALAYTFTHVLTQEVAYQSLVRRARQQYHIRIAQVLEAQFPEVAETQPALLAHHYTEAGCQEHAVGYWQRAGQQAAQRGTYQEAVGFYEQALGALQQLPTTPDRLAQTIDLHLALDEALFPLGAYHRSCDVLRAAERLATGLGDQRQLGWVTEALATAFRRIGAYDQAVALAQRAMALAMALGDVALQVWSALRLGQTYYCLGDYQRASDCFREVIASPLENSKVSEAVLLPAHGRSWLVYCLAACGEFSVGLALGAEAVRLAEAGDFPTSRCAAYASLGYLSLVKGAFRPAIAFLEQGLDLCRRWHNLDWLPECVASLGLAYALAGHLDDALPLLEQAVEQEAMMGGGLGALRITDLSQGYLLAGRLEEARTHAARALVLARERQDRGIQAYALWLLGEIAARGDLPEGEPAETCYQQGLALVDELGMRPLQAHCHLGLGMLYAKTGQREQARTALATAIDLYRAMEMTFWLPQAEAALAQVEGQ